MRCERTRRAPRGSGARGALLAGLLAALAAGGCGGDRDADRAAGREALERQFGRRDGSADSAAEAPSAATGAPVGRPDSSARGDEPGSRTPGETGGAAPAPPPPPGRTSPAAGTAETAGATPDGGGAPIIDPEAWLASADSAYRRVPSMRARFEQRVEVPLLDRTSTGVGVWYQEGRDRFRMDFSDPPDDLFVADGTFLWLYQPSQEPGQVIKAELARGETESGTADLLGRILAEARTAYDAVDEGAETLSGVPTRVIGLTPRGPSDYRSVRVWIAEGDRLVRRFRIEQENEMIRTVTLSALEPGVPLADSLFVFHVPPGVDVFEP